MRYSEQILHLGRKYGALVVFAFCLAIGGVAHAGDARSFLRQAQTLYDKGDVKGAVIELKNALQEDPSLTEARYLLGQVYLQEGDGNSAEKELRRAKALGAEGTELDLSMAEAYLLQRRFDEVLELLTPELEGVAELKARRLTLRGLALVGLERIDEATESLQLATEHDPKADMPILGLTQIDISRNDLEAASKRIDDLLGRQPDNRKALAVRAELDKRAGRLEDAVKTYTRLLKLDPDAAQTLLGRAAVYLAQGKLAEAELDLNQADKQVPNAVMGVYLRGLLAYRKGELNVASEALLKVLGVAPGHVPSQLLFGVVSFSKEDYELADEYLSRVNGSDPGNLPVAKLLAATRIRQQTPERAVPVLEPLLVGHGDDVQLVALLGSAYMQSGDHAKGAELMQRAVELDPDKAGLRTQLALGLLAGGETEAAVDQLKSAVDLGQDLIQADVLLVMAHLKKQQFDEAVAVGKALETRMPDNPVSYNLTGLAYLAKNEDAEAAERFNKALALDPEFVTAEVNLAKIDLRNKDLDAAERRYHSVLEKQPADLNALLGLAGIAEQRGDEAAMEQRLVEALEKSPHALPPGVLLAQLHLRRNEPLKALAVASDLVARFPRAPVALELLGKAQIAAGEMSNAVHSFGQLAELRPIAENYFLLGRTQTMAKSVANARKSLRKALELKPDFLPAKVALAALELEAGDQNAALMIALEMEKAHPESAVAHQLEGAARSALGEKSKAAAAYERAYELDKSAAVVQRLAESYKALGRTDDAVAVLRDWLGEQPDDLATRMILAMTLQVEERRQEALREYEILQEKDKGNAVVLNNMAWLYFLEGDGRALKFAEQAYDADPERPEVADTYGWILRKRGSDPQRALTLLQQAYVAFPTNAEIGYHVAIALHDLGRNDEAARTLRSLLDGNPGFADADAARALLRKIGK